MGKESEERVEDRHGVVSPSVAGSAGLLICFLYTA